MKIISTHTTLASKNLAKSSEFYQSIFEAKPMFADDNGSLLAINDNTSIMLMQDSFFKSFVPNKEISNNQSTCASRNTLTLQDKNDVDKLIDKALSAWAKEFWTVDNEEYMYSRNFEDLDGYLRQILWMDMSQMQ